MTALAPPKQPMLRGGIFMLARYGDGCWYLCAFFTLFGRGLLYKVNTQTSYPL